MTKSTKIPSTAEAWENGELGLSEQNAKPASDELTQQIEDALGLQAISIRLPKATIQTYKYLAELHGVGYQPLMRDAIVRWAESELKQLLAGAVESQRERAKRAPKARAAKTPKDDEPTPLKKAA